MKYTFSSSLTEDLIVCTLMDGNNSSILGEGFFHLLDYGMPTNSFQADQDIDMNTFYQNSHVVLSKSRDVLKLQTFGDTKNKYQAKIPSFL